MKSNQLLAIEQRSIKNLRNLFTEHHDELLEAIGKIEEEAQNQEADKIIVNIAHGIKLDLTGKSQTDLVTFSVRTKLETVNKLPDPDEPMLPGLRDDEDDDPPAKPISKAGKKK